MEEVLFTFKPDRSLVWNVLFTSKCIGVFLTMWNNCTISLLLLGQHLKFVDEVEALQVQVDKLETLGYNKIIALGHSGFDMDRDIAKRVRGVDVVIGGHTNTFLYTGILFLLYSIKVYLTFTEDFIFLLNGAAKVCPF